MKNTNLYLAASQIKALWEYAETQGGINWDTFAPAIEFLCEAVQEENENE